MKQLLIIATLILTTTAAVAGGGGISPKPRVGLISTCVPVDTNTIKEFVIYNTDAGYVQQNTYVEVTLKAYDLKYFFQVGTGIDASKAIGNHIKADVYVIDTHETFGFLSSGVRGDTQLQITDAGNGILTLSGSLKLTHAKNADFNGPTFLVNGSVSCSN